MSHPDEFLCRIPAEIVERYSDWTEVEAFRIVMVDENTVEVQVTNDLELATRPEVAS